MNKKFTNVKRVWLLVGVVIIFLANTGKAETITSIGTPWEDSSSWDLGRIPNASDDVIISGGILMSINTDATVNSLTIASGSNRLTLQAGVELTVTNTLTNNSGMTYGIEMQSNETQTASIIFGSTSGAGQLYYGRYMSGSTSSIKWHVLSSPTTNATISGVLDFYGEYGQNDLVVSNGNYAFASYNESTNLWKYYSTNPETWAGYMSSGQGIAMAITSSKTVNITGRIATGTVTRTINKSSTGTKPAGGWGWNAIGNPFTAALNATAFYNTNATALDENYGALYLWNAETQSYNTITQARPGNIQVGQGFVVRAANDGSSTITFNFGMRTHSPGTLLKSGSLNANNSLTTEEGEDYFAIDLFMQTDQFKRSAAFVFNTNYTMGLDPYLDAGLLSVGNMDIYSFIDGSDIKFSDQALPKERMDGMVIPLGIEMTKNAEATLSAQFTNFPDNMNVVLEDKLNNTFTDLKKDELKITLASSSSYNDRFYIHLNKEATTGVIDQNLSDIKIYAYNKQINVSGENTRNSILQIFNLQGSELLRFNLENTNAHLLNVASLNSGIYLVRLVGEGNMNFTEKIVVK